MPLVVTARGAIDAGSIEYEADAEVASVEYVDTVPKEFLAHAYDSGKVYFEDVSSDPWVRVAKARHAMMVGDTLVEADGEVCTITSDTDVGADVLLRMREGALLLGFESAALE